MNVEPTRIRIERTGRAVRTFLDAGMLIPRLVGAGPDGSRVATVAAGALLLGGDAVAIEVHVGHDCLLEIEEIGGTVAYGGSELPATWRVDIEVEPGGRLIWHGLPFVIAAGADVRRATHVTLGHGATALLRETLVLGRHGEAGGRIDSRTSVDIDGHAAFREQLELDGCRPRIGVLDARRVLDTAMVLGRRLDASGGVLQLEAEATLARSIGGQAHLANVDETWALWRATVVGERDAVAA